MDTMLAPTYIKSLPENDGWGNSVGLRRRAGSATAAQQYAITSYGRDEHSRVPRRPRSRTTTNFDCDIIYSQGQFLQYPEGVQQQ